MREVLRQLIRALEGGREQLICQVVETRGSTPRKAGALMVVDPDGGQAGTLGGGCVEAEVKQKAIRRLGQTGAELLAFVLDHDFAWADGLICGGKMAIVAEAVRGPGPLGYFRAYRKLLEAGDGFTEAVVVDPERAGAEPGARFLFDHGGAVAASWPARRPRGARRAGRPPVRPAPAGGPGGRRAVADPAASPAGDRRGGARRAGGRRAGRASRLRCLGRRRPPPVRQRRAVPRRSEVGRRAARPGPARAGGHVADLCPDRHPGARPRPGGAVSPGPDAGALRRADRQPPQDPAHLREPEGDGGVRVGAGRVAAPVGFDIGSQTVPEIAISIVAELIARRNLGPGGLAARAPVDPSDARAPAAGLALE